MISISKLVLRTFLTDDDIEHVFINTLIDYSFRATSDRFENAYAISGIMKQF